MQKDTRRTPQKQNNGKRSEDKSKSNRQTSGNIAQFGTADLKRTSQDNLKTLKPIKNNSLDTTFSHTGVATVDSVEIRANIVVGPDDKIWIVGTRNTDFAVYRFLPDGKIDSTFGENGKITTNIQRLDNRIYAMALQPDGKMVAGGYTHEEYPTTRFKITLARYLPDGKTGIISPTSKDGQISIYPNPANTYLLMKNNTGKSIQAITIYSVDGRKVKELTLQGENRIPIRSLRPGIYTVHLHVRDKTIKKKLTIVQ